MAEQTKVARAASSYTLSLLALAVAMALTACGGGGESTRPTPPPPPGQPPPPQPPPTTIQPPIPAHSEHLALTNAYEAREAGLTGVGTRIGVLDTGVNRDHPALAGRVVHNLVYVNSTDNNLNVDDVDGHGTAVAQAIAGSAFGTWPGGIAPGAEIVSARIINDEPPDDDGTGQGNEVDGALGLERIHRDMIDRGVRILNNSWGGLYWENPAATAAIANEYRDFIFANDGLVVFATGNLEGDDPTDMAALPSQPGPGGTMPAADLERGWLAVAALDRNDPNQLAEYSNACGVAMRYCLSAPGSVVVTGTDDAPDKPSYWRWTGTSFAAPLVSGTAALVWEAFPWFDNDLVRQTILGTATDLGDPGVDEIFGYGLLDVGKAVRGPARFDWGRVIADFDGMNSEWSNDIAGNGGLTKRGSGLLELSGNNSYRGETRVEGGVLRLSGALNRSAVAIGAEGVLSGDGRIAGNLDNAGTVFLDAGDGDTALTVGGNYRHRDGARLALLFGAGALDVGGNALLEGGTVHVAGVIDGYTTQNDEVVLRTEGTLSGAFNGYTFDSDAVFFQGALVHDYNFGLVLLRINRLDVHATASAFGTATAASLSAAQRVESAFRQIDGQRAGGSGAIADGFIRTAGEFQRIADEATAVASLSSLSGELHALASSTTFDAIDMGRRALSAQFGQATASIHGPQVWKRQLGQGGQGGFAGNGVAVDGWLIGRDHRIGDGIAGFAFGQTHADSHRDGSRDRGRDRQTQAQLYVGGLHGNAYTVGQAGFGRFDRQLERHLFTGRQSTAVTSAYSGEFFTANIESGYRFGGPEATLTPYVGAEYTRIDSEGFFESGADGFGLRADPWSSSRSQAIAGLRGERGWRGVTLHGYAEWQHTLGASGLDIEASFTGADAWSPLGGLQPGRSGGLFGIGLDAWAGRNGVVTLGWDQRFGPRGDARMVSLRYALGF